MLYLEDSIYNDVFGVASCAGKILHLLDAAISAQVVPRFISYSRHLYFNNFLDMTNSNDNINRNNISEFKDEQPTDNLRRKTTRDTSSFLIEEFTSTMITTNVMFVQGTLEFDAFTAKYRGHLTDLTAEA